jgi:hypothetical protein
MPESAEEADRAMNRRGLLGPGQRAYLSEKGLPRARFERMRLSCTWSVGGEAALNEDLRRGDVQTLHAFALEGVPHRVYVTDANLVAGIEPAA